MTEIEDAVKGARKLLDKYGVTIYSYPVSVPFRLPPHSIPMIGIRFSFGGGSISIGGGSNRKDELPEKTRK